MQITKISLSRLNWLRCFRLDACYGRKHGQQANRTAEWPRRTVKDFVDARETAVRRCNVGSLNIIAG